MKSYISLEDEIYINYNPDFLDKKLANYFYSELEKNIVYNTKEQSKVIMNGRPVDIPREQTAYGDKGTYYEFAGNKVYARQWNSDITGELILKIKDIVEQYTGQVYNFVLVNKYKNGDSYIGYHHDDERNLVNKSTIVGVSFGATRDFLFQATKIIPRGNNTISIPLTHGSIICINYPTNSYWKHSIPKRTNIKSPRISLTFRQMKM